VVDAGRSTAERPAYRDLTLAQAGSAFSVDAYRALGASHTGNLVYSPASITLALAMTYAGARGDNAKEMAYALRFDNLRNRSTVHQDFGSLIDTLGGLSSHGNQLRIANRLFSQQGLPFEQGFKDITREQYSAPIEQLDFVDQTEEARTHINEWVATQTVDKIKDLLKPGNITRTTSLVLVNAVYLKSAWQTLFDKQRTRDADFFAKPEAPVTVPLMYARGAYRVATVPGGVMAELPYKGDQMSMVVLVPDERDGLPALEQTLSLSNLHTWLAALAEVGDVDLFLPRFKIRTRLDLVSMFQELGMTQAFGGGDFSAMSSAGLAISAIIHEAIIEVDEEGTVAAAATAVVMDTRGMPDSSPFRVRADRPFLYMIRDRVTGTILFMGRVANPSV